MDIPAFFQQFAYDAYNVIQFNSVFFIGLFSVFYLVYASVFHNIRWRNIALLAFSLFFYYKLSGLYVLLMIAVGTSDFFIGRAILKTQSEKAKKGWLFLSLFISVGSLVYFKYTKFILDYINIFFETSFAPPEFSLLMPLGISFYIFKTISYVMDCYNEMIDEPEKNYFNYLLYVSLFTNIIAGPIARARDLLPQLNSPLVITAENIGKGFFLILVGATKKYLVADYLWMNFLEKVFSSPTILSGFDNLMAMIMGTVQFYYDFSGYTDMMLGLSLLMGLQIKDNFNRPFLAQNISDFWRRWHITLSTWLNEYVFMPLSFSMRKMKRTGAVFASIITFIISGIWHGPKFTYVFWGLLHGLAIGWDVATADARSKVKKVVPATLYKVVSIFLTFSFICFTIVIFNVKDLATAGDMYRMIFAKMDWSVAPRWFAIYWREFIIFFFALLVHFLPVRLKETSISYYTHLHWSFKTATALVVLVIIFQFYSAETQPFIYLQF